MKAKASIATLLCCALVSVSVCCEVADAPQVTVTPTTSTTQWGNTPATSQATIPTYPISGSSCVNGALVADKTQAHATDTVTVIPTPSSGYKLKHVTVNGVNIGNVTSFAMPRGAVSLGAVFEAAVYVPDIPTSMQSNYWSLWDAGFESGGITATPIVVTVPAGLYKTVTLYGDMAGRQGMSNGTSCGQIRLDVLIGSANTQVFRWGRHNGHNVDPIYSGSITKTLDIPEDVTKVSVNLLAYSGDGHDTSVTGTFSNIKLEFMS